MATKTVQESSLTSIANAIRTKGGTTAPLEFPTDFVTAIQDIPTGGGGSSATPKDVNFYDYDGTVVDSYTASEFAALSAMPANPTHDGLTAQGWNWSLADAKAYVAKYGRLNIGQMYVTDDGKTRLYCHFYEGRLTPRLGFILNGSATIDWGDESNTETVFANNSSINKSHHYNSEGEYVITIAPIDNAEITISGYSGGISLLLKKDNSDTSVNYNRVYTSCLEKVEIGSNVTITDNAFAYCTSLRAISLPESINDFGSGTFSNCFSLSNVVVPKYVSIIPSRLLYSSDVMNALILPKAVSVIGSNAFEANPSLRTAICNTETIPSGAFKGCRSLGIVIISEIVANITSEAFANCYGLSELRFLPTTPPTVSYSSAFDNLPSDLVVYVPAGTLSAYQSASNYSSIAGKMVEMAA